MKVKPEIARDIISDQGFRLIEPPKSPGGKKRHAVSGLDEAVRGLRRTMR